MISLLYLVFVLNVTIVLYCICLTLPTRRMPRRISKIVAVVTDSGSSKDSAETDVDDASADDGSAVTFKSSLNQKFHYYNIF